MMRNLCHCGTRHALMTAIYVLSCIVMSAAQADGLGRLFFTPEQRAQLDHAYTRNATSRNNSSSVVAVNGIVQKHGGARTVWINGKAQGAGKSDEYSPDAVPVAVPGKVQPVPVKVGQRLLLEQSSPQHSGESGK